MSRTGLCLLGALGMLWAGGLALAPTGGTGGSALAATAGANRIAIDSPDGARARRGYNITIHGFAHRRARAFIFVDYLGCARSFGVERRRAGKAWYSYAVTGAFSKVSGWKSSTAGVDHACAYLIDHRSGRVLATARIAFRIARRRH
jgi:hypothetical protein